MGWIAVRMLTGNRRKWFGLVVGVAFASLLITQQTSIFCGLMRLTTSQIRDIQDAELWIMHPSVQFVGDFRPISESSLYQIRGVEGIEWAVPLFKGFGRTRLGDGSIQEVILLGFDDSTLVGAPQRMLLGSISALRQPDAVIIDDAGYQIFWPGEPFELGRTFEMNERRAVVVGICSASRTFRTYPIIYTLFQKAKSYVPPERNLMSYVLAKSQADVSGEEACRRVERETGLRALTREGFSWWTMRYYLENTGIPANFGITVLLGFLIGLAVTGQTFYLFTIENLAQFGVLKAMGTGNGRIVGMILLQALLVALIGYGIGVGLAAVFGEATRGHTRLTFYMPWQVLAGSGLTVLLMVMLSSLVCVRRVLVLETAIVFRN
jgi:putative ABC transport system permease protein